MGKQHFTFEYRYAHMLGATWLTIRRRWIWKGAVKYIGFVTILMFGILELFQPEHPLEQIVIHAFTGLTISLACLAATALYWLWCVPRNVRKSYQQLSLDGGTVRLSFDENEVEIADATNSLKLPWNRLVKWSENNEFLLFFRTDAFAHYIPNEHVTATAIGDIVAHLKAAGVRKA